MEAEPTAGSLEGIMGVETRMTREQQISKVGADLEKYSRQLDPDSDEAWAVQVNIGFTEACRSPWTYWKWLRENVPMLREPSNRDRLMELADFDLPYWAAETHRSFIELERWAFPGLLKPIRRVLMEQIRGFSRTKNEPVVVASLGSGAMELERQLIEGLGELDQPVVVIGVDLSESILGVARDNLGELEESGRVEYRRLDKIDIGTVEELKALAQEKGRHVVAVLKGDAFGLGEALPENSFDIVYHVRLKHHLGNGQKERLDEMAVRMGIVAVEMDDYYDPSVFPFPSAMTWGRIPTLNGAILSYIRDPSKKELREEQRLKEAEGWTLWIHPVLGYYMRINDGRES